MTSVERTAYPRFGRMVTARELEELSPTPDEVSWARDRARPETRLLALVVSPKCFQRLGYFLKWDEVPEVVVEHLRRWLELVEGIAPNPGSERSANRQRRSVREHLGVRHWVIGRVPSLVDNCDRCRVLPAAMFAHGPAELDVHGSAGW